MDSAIRTNHVPEVLLNLLGTFEIGRRKVASVPAFIDSHTSRE